MDAHLVFSLMYDLLVILATGLVSGAICRRLGVSMLVGYLVAGALLGPGLVGWLSSDAHELEYLAEAGVLLLLFSIGIEFSIAELRRMIRPFLTGGTTQMVLVAVPVAIGCAIFGRPWHSAALLGVSAAFSSTVLVFKALEEWGRTASPHGRRAIAILLFQDAAVVPLILLVPLLSAWGQGPGGAELLHLMLSSLLFLLAVPVARSLIVRWLAPWLSQLRSVELLVLFSVVVLGSFTLVASFLGLPPMVGAFGAGLVLNGNRLTRQIDAVILPFRETFAAVFFVSLGTLIRFDALLATPLAAIGVLAGILCLKTCAGGIALRLAGLPWMAAMGMGMGLAQVGEFAFVVLLEGLSTGAIGTAGYDLMMFVAVASLILTPQLLKIGLKLAERGFVSDSETAAPLRLDTEGIPRAVVVGIGPIGTQTASQLELKGYDVCLIDLSAVNLHRFTQQGFRTVIGDASVRSVLDRADAPGSSLVVVTVPEDRVAMRIVAAVRRLNTQAIILVRCRFQASLAKLRALGATDAFCEETELASRVFSWLDKLG